MATSYKTPGVYIEEIPKFPPSVAQVETAVPAFIGYTEKAEKNGEQLFNIPLKIFSMAEFEAYFGKGPGTGYTVYLDANDNVSQVVPETGFCLYDSMRSFYDNGGGKCYIISVGKYPASPASADVNLLIAALMPLEKEDEPTLIVCPDATLTDTGLYTFQQKALQQCAKLGDRFLICDLLRINEKENSATLDARVEGFRDNIGINDLKYGAAYVPYIKSALPKDIKFRNLTLKRGDQDNNSDLELEGLTTDNNIAQLIYDLKNAKKSVDGLKELASTDAGAGGILTGTSKTLEEEFKKLFDAYAAEPAVTKRQALQDIYAFATAILAGIHTERLTWPAKVAATPNPASPASSVSFVLANDVGGIITSTGIQTVFETLAKHQNALKAADPADEVFFTAGAPFNSALSLFGLDQTQFDNLKDEAAIGPLYAGKTDAEQTNEGKKAIAAAYGALINFYNTVLSAALTYEKTLEDSLVAGFGVYKNMLAKVSVAVSEIPPSGAVAGVYAAVDNARGVWKAPANVSLASVLGPSVQISHEKQADLNVDTVAGKSINAIRAFTGKGTLVWGARTLAGNDNEWRYINVRRFFNMVEESCKKSTEVFVFEPNDANTWIKVQGMIENFLITLWRQGALQGAKPEHAFYVAVGLGKTMTPLDILEGRMIVEIGMAVVRPAEFIILRFSHKMAES